MLLQLRRLALAALLIFTLVLPTMGSAAQADSTALRAQLVKERTSHAKEIASLKRQLNRQYKVEALDAIRFGAVVTGGSYRQGVALTRCETGGTFSPFARNPTPLGGKYVHATGLWQWLWDESGNASRGSSWDHLLGGKFGEFDPHNPYIQSVASYLLAEASGGWFNGWKDICGTIADRS